MYFNQLNWWIHQRKYYEISVSACEGAMKENCMIYDFKEFNDD